MRKKYKDIFGKVEQTLLQIAGKKEEVERYKNPATWDFSDENIFTNLVHIVFYSGFRSSVVDEKLGIINSHFPNYQTVSKYDENDILRIMNDVSMIRNELKIRAIVKNSKVFQNIVSNHGTFKKYLDSFEASESFENLLLLKEELQYKFEFLGEITVFHLLTDLGFQVLKPDRVLTRIFKRLDLIENEKQLLKTIIQGRKFATETGHHIRYVDIIFVSYGQMGKRNSEGLEKGICLEQNPQCNLCAITEHCNYYTTNNL
ncbi:DNA-3-methyladenine glycosylase I [Leptospira levettii]|uniref:DNA-3-methyladenine glycosylase I n=1 Tax=Leptospira levettii TaxID=2023178 RepID=UPI001AEFB530|nr:DNA-3-methyladenine glycosylase I [Leptospira levettii]